MADDFIDAIWVSFAGDGSISRCERAFFQGGTRFVSEERVNVPAVKRSLLTAVRQDPKVKYALREIREEFAKQARSITEELTQLYPEATGALGMASARIDELFGLNSVPRQVRGSRRGRLLCLLGMHRLVPMSWLTNDRQDRGLVCNRCFRSFAEG